MTVSPTERTPISDGEAEAGLICERARKALRASKDPTVTDDAISTRWYGDDKNASYVGRLLSSTSGANISLGKVLALPKSLARSILTRALASLDDGGTNPRVTLDRLAMKCGDATAALVRDLNDDGKINQHDVHEANFAAIAAIALAGVTESQRAREGTR